MVEPPEPLPAPSPERPQLNLQQEVESPKFAGTVAAAPCRVASSHTPIAACSGDTGLAVTGGEGDCGRDAIAAHSSARPVAGMETDRPPAYPEIARRRGEQGSVLLRVAVSIDGLPVTVTVAKSSGFQGFDSAAVEAVKLWRFVPATRDRAPVAATAAVPVRFRLVD